jgi:hypothetical protein
MGCAVDAYCDDCGRSYKEVKISHHFIDGADFYLCNTCWRTNK